MHRVVQAGMLITVFAVGFGTGWYLAQPERFNSDCSSIMVENASAGTAMVVRTFDQPGTRLKGVVIRAKSPTAKSMVAWRVQDHLLVGHLYDSTGQDLTAVAAKTQEAMHPMDALQAYTSPQRLAGSPEPLEEVFTRARKANGALKQGRGPRELVVFTSPACTYCRRFKEMADEYEAQYAEMLTIRWLPVGFREVDVEAAASLLGGGHSARQQVLENSSLLESISVNPQHPVVPAALWVGDRGVHRKIGALKREEFRALWAD